MCRFVAERKDNLAIRMLPSVPEVLTHLRAQGAILEYPTRCVATLEELMD